MRRNDVPRRRITVESSVKEISMKHLEYFVVVKGGGGVTPPVPTLLCAEGFWIDI
jgi:hypothetical protein